MVYFVAFDGSRLSESALMRAVAYGSVVETPVHTHTVVPRNNAEYARERGWLDPDEPFDLQRVAVAIREQVSDIAPAAAFDYDVVDRYAPRGTIARRLREAALSEDATVVFVGSENAGRVVGPLTTVGSNVAADDRYDVHLVRRELPRAPDGRTGRQAAGERAEFWLP